MPWPDVRRGTRTAAVEFARSGETFRAVPGRNGHDDANAARGHRGSTVRVVAGAEAARLAEAARGHVHEFLLVISHAKLRGATGAWVAPLAIV